MAEDRKTTLQRMDGLLEWTGFPRRVREQKSVRLRRLKWLPLLVLLMAFAGLILTFKYPVYGGVFGSWPVLLGVAIAQWGPMRPKKPGEDMDERDTLWRTRSNLFAYATISIVAMIGTMGLGCYIVWSAIVLQAPPSMEALGYGTLSGAYFLFVLFVTLPTLHASWTMPEIIEDEPEDEGRLSFVKPRRR